MSDPFCRGCILSWLHFVVVAFCRSCILSCFLKIVAFCRVAFCRSSFQFRARLPNYRLQPSSECIFFVFIILISWVVLHDSTFCFSIFYFFEQKMRFCHFWPEIVFGPKIYVCMSDLLLFEIFTNSLMKNY